MTQLTMYPALANSPQTDLASAIDAVQVTIPLTDASKLPAGPNICTIGSDETAETVLYTNKSGNTLTGVTRGFQSAAKAWSTGIKVGRNFTAYDYDTLRGNLGDHETRMSLIESRYPLSGIYRDALKNAGLEVIQRFVPLGSTTLATVTSAYVVDRVKSFNNGSGANATVSQVSVSDLDGSTSGLQIIHVATPTTGGQLGHTYTVEAKDSYKLAGQQVVYALKIKGVGAMDRITVNARYKTSESAIVSSSTLVGSSAAQAINNTGWVVVLVVVTLPIRATLTTNGVIGFEVIASKTTAEASGDGFIMAEMELIKANADLGFQPNDFAIELLRCQRYYEKSGNYNGAVGAGPYVDLAAWQTANNKVSSETYYRVSKRTTPTIVIYDASGAVGKASWIQHGTTTVSLASVVNNSSEFGFNVISTATDSTPINNVFFGFSADAEL